jgi:hypothetical protein
VKRVSAYPPVNSRVVLTPRGLRFLEDVLWEWIAIQERSIRLWNGKDALWWHNERVCVGGLAGAVWRSGGVVLEEYAADKFGRDGMRCKARGTAPGRGDMEFILAGQRIIIEAKHRWPRLGIREVTTALSEAERDVARCQAAGERLGLAVVFASPSMADDSMASRLPAWIEGAMGLRECARAWVFPDLGRELRAANNRTYPGAAVFLKRARP